MQTATSRSRALIGAPPEGVDGSFINTGTLLGARRAKQRNGHRRQQEWGAYSALVTAVSRNWAPTARWSPPSAGMGRLQRVGHRRQQERGAYSALVSARSGETAPSQPLHSAVVKSEAPALLWTAMARVALSEKAPVDFDKGRQRVTVGKFWCWLLSSLLICVMLHFVSFASFASATVVTVLLNFDTALRFVCHSCFAGAEHRKRGTGAAAREQWDAGRVSNNAHVSGVATVACLLCLHRVSLLRHGFIFWYCSVNLCVCVFVQRWNKSNTRRHER